MKILFLIAMLILSVLLPCHAFSDELSNSTSEIVVYKVDESNSRLFVHADEDTFSALDSTCEVINKVKSYITANKQSWGNDWSVSFFSDAKYAYYKDDAAVMPYHHSGLWQENYIAEYNNTDKLLITFPAISEKGKRMIISKQCLDNNK
jgi:hypothetical protein